jgi:spermidine synthase
MNPLIFILFFISGACGLIYQVVWMRMMTYVFGSTVFAVSTVLAAFMAGLALSEATTSASAVTRPGIR